MWYIACDDETLTTLCSVSTSTLYLIGIPRADEGFKVKVGVSCMQGVWGHLEILSGSIAKPWREPKGGRSPRKLLDSRDFVG